MTMEQLRDSYGCGVQCASFTLSDTEILDLNSNPTVLVSAQGAGTAIQMIGGFFNFTVGGTVYASTTDIYVGTSSTFQYGFMVEDILDNTASKIVYFKPSDLNHTSASTGGIIENEDLVIGHPTADPTLGDGTATGTILYRVVTL
jgi:hypothetical protein